MYYSSSEILLI